LPSASELGELIVQGLPNGSAQWLWSSDTIGFDGTDYPVAAKLWKGTEPWSPYSNSAGDLSWAYKTGGPYGFRCLFYALDTSYTGPQAASCAGGCTAIKLPGGSGATMWFDAFDRAPATATDALDTCRKAGGHLSMERDLFEGARHGLSNGSSSSIWTSDAEVGIASSILLGTLSWSGVDTAFNDLYPTYHSWDYPTNTHPYRCMWTNELR
jgi:hypothetical protein